MIKLSIRFFLQIMQLYDIDVYYFAIFFFKLRKKKYRDRLKTEKLLEDQNISPMNLNINNNKTLRYSITTQAMNINFLTHTHS